MNEANRERRKQRGEVENVKGEVIAVCGDNHGITIAVTWRREGSSTREAEGAELRPRQ
jgi:hypothetical protein